MRCLTGWKLRRRDRNDFGKYDFELERYFDFGMFSHSFTNVIKKMPNIEL